MLPYRDRLTGNYEQYAIDGITTARPIGSADCVYVNLIVPELQLDGSPNGEAYWGDANLQWHGLMPATETGDKPVNSLSKIYVRAKNPAAPVRLIVEVYR